METLQIAGRVVMPFVGPWIVFDSSITHVEAARIIAEQFGGDEIESTWKRGSKFSSVRFRSRAEHSFAVKIVPLRGDSNTNDNTDWRMTDDAELSNDRE